MKDFSLIKLGEICEITSSKRIYAREYKNEGVPFYRSKEIIEKSENKEISVPLFISVDRYNEIKNKFGVPSENDILLTSVGTLGTSYIVKKDDYFYFKDGNITWLKNFSTKVNPKYIFLWLNSDFGKKPLIARAIGSSQGAITIDILKKYPIAIPSINKQNKIVQFIDKYNILIELNDKRINLLKKEIKQIYKEWFVRFRFPGAEKEKFSNGLPIKWKIIKAKDLFNITIGRTPPREESWWFTNDSCDSFNWVSITDMRNNVFVSDTEEKLTKEAVQKKHIPIVKKGTVILSFKLTVGVPCIVNNDCCTNEAIAHFNIEDSTITEYLYSYLDNFEYSILGNTSSIGDAVNSKIISNMKIILPDNDLIKKYHNLMSPIFESINIIQDMNNNLKRQRSTILNRILSEKIEVK